MFSEGKGEPPYQKRTPPQPPSKSHPITLSPYPPFFDNLFPSFFTWRGFSSRSRYHLLSASSSASSSLRLNSVDIPLRGISANSASLRFFLVVSVSSRLSLRRQACRLNSVTRKIRFLRRSLVSGSCHTCTGHFSEPHHIKISYPPTNPTSNFSSR